MAHYIITHSDKPCIQQPPLHPIGFGKLFDITPFCSPEAISFQKPILALALLVYVGNWSPILSLSYVLGYLTLVYQAVNGHGTIFHGYQIVALTLLMQWCGHCFLYIRNRILKLKPKDEPEGYYTFSYSSSSSSPSTPRGGKLQSSGPHMVTEEAFIYRLSGMAVCAVYVTSAISKHIMSRGTWFDNAEYFVTNFISVNEREYYNLGIRNSDFVAEILPQILMRYPIIARWFFGSAFYLELLLPLFVYNRFTMMVGGVVTWVMHEVIATTMRLNFKSHQRVMLAYFIDPIYWIQVSYAIYQVCAHYYRVYHDTVNHNGDSVNLKDVPLTPLLAPTDHHHKVEKEKDEDKVEPSSYRNQKKKSLVQRLLAFLWKFPFKSMIAMIIVCLYMKEVFPFSNFPMYGKPPLRGDYFYISDKDGQPLFTEVYFQMSGAQMKRSFFTSCKKYMNTNQPNLFRWNTTALEHCGNQSLAFFDKIVRHYKRNYLEWHKPLYLNWVYLELQKKNMTITRQTKIIAKLDRNETYLAENPDLEALKIARDIEKAKSAKLKRKKELMKLASTTGSSIKKKKKPAPKKKAPVTLSKGSNNKNSTIPIKKKAAVVAPVAKRNTTLSH